MNNLFGAAFAIVIACAMAVSSNAVAQDKASFRSEAKSSITLMRRLGEPKDRCTMAASIGDGGVVLSTLAASPLKAGDRIVSFNQIPVSAVKRDELAVMLRKIDPGTVIPLAIDRSGQRVDIEATCMNARPMTEGLLNVLGLVAAGRFDDCVTAIEKSDSLGSFGSEIKAQCASFAPDPKRYNIAQLSFDALSGLGQEAYWDPSQRDEYLKRLRGSEDTITQGLGAARFQELVAATRTWPNGERMFDETAPDWSLFRRRSETAFASRLIDPESARFEWPYGFTFGYWKPLFGKRIEGYWTCGRINARNRMGGYTGSTAFVVVLAANGAIQYSEMGTSDDFDLLSTQCSNSA